MKKIYIYIIAASLCLTSCSKNENNAVFVSDIEGLWTLISLESINFYDFNNDGIATNNILNETNCYFNQQILFNPDKTAVLRTSSYSEIFIASNFDSTDDYIYQTNCIVENEKIDLKWAADRSSITLTGNGKTETLPVFNERFSFIDQDALKVENGKDGVVMITESLKYTFQKQQGIK